MATTNPIPMKDWCSAACQNESRCECFLRRQAASVPPPVRGESAVQKVWIVSDYPRGGIRAVVSSLESAEAEITAIRAEHPDLRRDDFTVQVERVRGGVEKGLNICLDVEDGVHRCSGCGHRWQGLAVESGRMDTGAELCGDCWRTAQPVLHGPPVRGEQETAEPTKWTDGPYANSPSRFDCLECMMRGIAVDEDGCCKSCGHDAERIGLCKTLHVTAPVRAEAAKTDDNSREAVLAEYKRHTPNCSGWQANCLDLRLCNCGASPVREAEPLKALVDGAAITCESAPCDRRVVIRFGDNLERAQALFAFLSGENR